MCSLVHNKCSAPFTKDVCVWAEKRRKTNIYFHISRPGFVLSHGTSSLQSAGVTSQRTQLSGLESSGRVRSRCDIMYDRFASSRLACVESARVGIDRFDIEPSHSTRSDETCSCLSVSGYTSNFIAAIDRSKDCC